MINGLQLKSIQQDLPETHIRRMTEVRDEITKLIAEAASVSHTSPVDATHLFRKRLKLYRAYLKLLRACISDGLYKTANAFLRDMGRKLSELRDAHVRDILLTEISQNQNFSSFHRLLPHLLETNRKTVTSLQKEKITDENLYATQLSALAYSKDIEAFFSQLEPDTNRIFTTFTNTVHSSKIAYKNCSSHHAAEDLHEWRKRLKDVQYQIEILVGTEKAQQLPLFTQVSEIGDILGQINDTHMVIEWINNLSIPVVVQTNISAFLDMFKEQNKSGIRLAKHKGEKLYTLTSEQLEIKTSSWL